MDRFKMSFNNSGAQQPAYYNNMGANLTSGQKQSGPTINGALNAPMIDRVYKARPGCSACGKKVA
jgi:hypothetical protein